jgi:NADH-quinone oxidoreductase subunit M
MLNGFIGEFTIVTGAFEMSKIWAAFAVTGIVLGAAYLLWLYQRTMLGKITNEKNERLPDLNWREWAYFTPLIVIAFWIGLYPKPLFEILDKPVANIVMRVRPDYYQNQNRVREAVVPAPAPMAIPVSATH